MDGLTFVRQMREDGANYPPIGAFVGFAIGSVERGALEAIGTPTAAHYNPLDVVHGGFSSTLLDLALGLVSVTILPSMGFAVTTTDLSLRYVRPIMDTTGTMTVNARVLHSGKRIVVAEALLRDANGKLYTIAQSTLLIVPRR